MRSLSLKITFLVAPFAVPGVFSIDFLALVTGLNDGEHGGVVAKFITLSVSVIKVVLSSILLLSVEMLFLFGVCCCLFRLFLSALFALVDRRVSRFGVKEDLFVGVETLRIVGAFEWNLRSCTTMDFLPLLRGVPFMERRLVLEGIL